MLVRPQVLVQAADFDIVKTRRCKVGDGVGGRQSLLAFMEDGSGIHG